ncbi:hypothetical protein VSVS05_03278 [Vibrio scophthalmi]|uniref:Glutathione peroxidase n=3 Tax=Vibrio scophthalmi TaxID=45658 RepID=A0A1C7FEH5_9VIBR|nr:hypothetical protein VSVS05_03278 [Vibrio scophthalmi]
MLKNEEISYYKQRFIEPKPYFVYNDALFIFYKNMNMSDNKPALPDHLAGNPRSPFFVEECFEHQIGIRLNGKERTDVEEYCISEGWVKIPSPKALDRRGQPILITLKGTVEAYYV